MSRPWARSSVASASTAAVGEGLTRAMRRETDRLTGCLQETNARWYVNPQRCPRRPRSTNATLKLVSPYQPAGDQGPAIEGLVEGLGDGLARQILLGVTGSGKTYTMANVIERVQRPAIILAPNKTLAAQLYGEMREFFPRNSVEYFVSYYDYYQPEAYVPSSDTYIEKDASINQHIEQMRCRRPRR